MSPKNVPALVWVGLLCIAMLLLGACAPLAPASSSQIANPASENCSEQGGTLTIEARGDGGQYGVCTFEDNRQCEEWALFHGDCPVGGIKVTGSVTPAARYCAISGGEYQVDEAATANADQEEGTCTFPDGQSCDVWDYFNGICSPTTEADDQSQATLSDSTDPFAYCAVAGSDDAPADETGADEIPDVIVQGMIDQGIVAADAPASIQQAALWRCMDGNVWVCAVGANLPCGEKADLSETPTEATTEFCQANPDADAIPAATAERATVYSWKCDGETPTVIEQVFNADAQGYLAEFWYELTPPE